jgi:hypothetical protein
MGITANLQKLPQNHRERRTRFPGTKYLYPSLLDTFITTKQLILMTCGFHFSSGLGTILTSKVLSKDWVLLRSHQLAGHSKPETRST